MLIDFRHGNAQKLANLLRGHHGPRRRAMGHRVSESGVQVYAVRNNGDQSPGAQTVTVTLDTQIHRVPDDNTVFELASSEVTIKAGGYYTFSFVVSLIASNNPRDLAGWIEEDGVEIPGSRFADSDDTPNTSAPSSVGRSFDHLVVAGKVYRVRFFTDQTGTIQGNSSNGYSRLDINRL